MVEDSIPAAVNYVLKQAELGDPISQNEAGYAYRTGKGVNIDDE